jgi:transposase
MERYTLTDKQMEELKRAHRMQREKQYADRIKAVVALSNGRPPSLIAEMLLIDEKTVRNYFDRFCELGIPGLLNDNYKGSSPKISDDHIRSLTKHLDDTIYSDSIDIIEYIKSEYGIEYSRSGLIDLLHRLGYSYKKPKHVPGKADAAAQEAFIDEYRRLKASKAENDVILFADATHPQHNSSPSYGWIRTGVDKDVKANCGRQRLNINGVIDIETFEPTVDFYDTINAQSTIDLFKQVEAKYKKADRITIIIDNARYYRNKELDEYISTSRIELLFLPPYSPNLNLIERYWKYFRKKVINNKYYPRFSEFIEACRRFFRERRRYLKDLKTLLTENFHICGT